MKENGKSRRHYPARQIRYPKGNQSTILFVTICTKSRKAILAHPEIHSLLLQAWRTADHWSVGCYTVLPDHIHLFCSPNHEDAANIKRWVAYWKSIVSKNWPHIKQKPIWQRDCWDRQLRHGEAWRSKWEYVRHNPVRHGLVQKAEDWPYQGEITPLFWHDQ
ncbi:MAG: hypothetical protein L3J39_18685 [Verrucomicrobiales bacterium]|nr:hypothetical protein [Verrucomicrobiales bacterium]